MDFKYVSRITENHMHSHDILMTDEAAGDQEVQGDACHAFHCDGRWKKAKAEAMKSPSLFALVFKALEVFLFPICHSHLIGT